MHPIRATTCRVPAGLNALVHVGMVDGDDDDTTCRQAGMRLSAPAKTDSA